MNKILNIFFNPFIISIPIAWLVIMFLPSLFNKFEIVEVKQTKIYNERQFFHDLNHDGLDEYIQLAYGRGSKDLPFLSCNTDFSIDSGYRHLHEINFDKQWLEKTKVTFGDYNNDNKDEMYVFARSKDSLFLLVFEPLDNKILKEQFISKTVFHDDVPDCGITVGGLVDFNLDHTKEYIFAVTAGLSLSPRSIYAFDSFNDTLFIKNVKYANIELNEKSIIEDQKLGPIIIPGSFASKNFTDTTIGVFTDEYAWLMPLDSKIDFLFDPTQNKGEKGGITAFPILEGSDIFIYAYFRNYIPDGKNFLRKYSISGELLEQMEYGFSNNTMLIKTGSDEHSKLYLHNTLEESVYFINPNLKLTNILNYNPFRTSWFEEDLDKDGKNEFIILDPIQKIFTIYRNDFSFPIEYEFPFFGNHVHNVSHCSFINPEGNLFIQVGDNTIFYHYGRNKLYILKYPFYLGIYLLISLFLYILLKFQKRNLQKKFDQEKRMTELELLTIKKQIDPHFTFNAINTLSSIFYKEDKKKAHEFLVDFSSLIRNTLNHSKKIAIPLKDEIDFVQNYLKLQQFRYSDNFDFKIHIDKNVDQNIMVPRMIIQTFAENSVKHGLVNKEGKGRLVINIHPMTPSHRMSETQHLQIEIADNGIGRYKSKQVLNYKQISTGKGHDIIKQIVDMYNRLNAAEVSFEITDLKTPNNKNTGTKVIVKI